MPITIKTAMATTAIRAISVFFISVLSEKSRLKARRRRV